VTTAEVLLPPRFVGLDDSSSAEPAGDSRSIESSPERLAAGSSVPRRRPSRARLLPLPPQSPHRTNQVREELVLRAAISLAKRARGALRRFPGLSEVPSGGANPRHKIADPPSPCESLDTMQELIIML